MSSKLKIVWVLPGGMEHYVENLKKILEEVENDKPTSTEFAAWLKKEYGIKDITVKLSIRAVKNNLGFLEKNDNHMELTVTAKEFLRTPNNKLVLESLKKHVLGFDEIISALADGRRLTLDEVHKVLLEKCDVNWKSKNQTQLRLCWLIGLGYVNRENKKYYWTNGKNNGNRGSSAIDNYIEKAYKILKNNAKMNEADTSATLVEPLLKEVLGWDTENPDEINREHSIGSYENKDRVDIALILNDDPVVFIEVKSANTQLQNRFAKQAINYAHADGVSWCILTNGHELRVYNAFWKVKGIERKMLFRLSIDEYKEKISKLKLLSKESLTLGKLDKIGDIKHAKIIFSQWLTQEENNIIKKIVESNSNVNEECLRQAIRKIL
ncbi:MAG: type I restriction endonuclease [Candidatus Bathyarchaeota archaeon]|nr:type I restriction endonuclease [Candidatus Bathyarchaeota archaeon]